MMSDGWRLWSSFFEEIASIVSDAERQDGIATVSYAEYVIERLEVSIGTCNTVQHQLDESGEQSLQECVTSISQLVRDLRIVQQKWEQYVAHVDCPGQVFHPDTRSSSGRRGRPRFVIEKSQIEYLASLSFKWTEIACILGISRMTLYR